MIHTKSNVLGIVENYQKMYNSIKNWSEPIPFGMYKGHYLESIGHTIDDTGYFGWTGDAAKNEIRHYKEVNKAYKALMFALESALGMEQESNFER